MGLVKISELIDAGTFTGTEKYPVVQSGNTKKASPVGIPATTDAVIHVSNGALGNDANSGLTEDKPKLTIAAGVAAISALTGFGAGSGGTLKIAYGDYVLPSTVTYAGDRLVIKGAGYGLTRIIAPANSRAFDIGQAGVIGREFRMEGVTLYRATPGGAPLIRVQKMDQSRITDCGFAGGTTNIEMTNCIASIVDKCGINSFTDSGLAIDNSDQVSISKNTWETNFGGVNHVKVNSGNKALSIADNIFSTAVRAVFVDGGPSDDCSITDNVVENCANGFIIGGLTNPSSSRWVITGNNLRGTNAASSVGIRVYGSNHDISGNNVSQYTASIDETGAATSGHLVVGNKVDVPVAITSTGSVLGLNGAGDINLPVTAKFSTIGSAFFGTSVNPTAGAVRIFPLSAGETSIIQVGNGSAWETVIEFRDVQRMAFFGVPAISRPTALTAADAAVVDAIYGTEEVGVINNMRTRIGELETKLRALGLIT